MQPSIPNDFSSRIITGNVYPMFFRLGSDLTAISHDGLTEE